MGREWGCQLCQPAQAQEDGHTSSSGKESLHTYSSKYTLHHICQWVLKRVLTFPIMLVQTIFQSSWLQLFAECPSNLPIKSQTDFWQPHLLLLARVAEHRPERVIFVNPFYPKGRHTQKVAEQVPPAQGRGSWSREPSDLYQNMLASHAQLRTCY